MPTCPHWTQSRHKRKHKQNKKQRFDILMPACDYAYILAALTNKTYADRAE